MTPQICPKPPEILPITYTQANFREPTDNLPITYRRLVEKSPPLIGGSLGSHPTGVANQSCPLTNNNLRTLARERWDTATAFRVGIIAGELNLAIVNPYRGNRASLYRQGLRRGRGPTRNDSAGVGW